MKFSILGGGKWGTTLAVLYAHKLTDPKFADQFQDSQIHLWVHPDDVFLGVNVLESILSSRYAPRLPKIRIPDIVVASSELETVVNGSDILINAVPSEHLEHYLKSIKSLEFQQFVNASKGVINDEPIYLTFRKYMPDKPYAVLSGANVAQQIANKFLGEKGTAFSALGFRPDSSPDLLEILDYRPYMRLYPTDQILAVEYCGILKQIYAMVLGACRGIIGEGNTHSGLIQACGREIKLLINEFTDEDPRIFDDLPCGYPDLLVTSTHGRNGKVGYLLATEGKEAVDRFVEQECVEGFRVLESVYKRTRGKRLHLPILEQTYSVFFRRTSVEQAVTILLNN